MQSRTHEGVTFRHLGAPASRVLVLVLAALALGVAWPGRASAATAYPDGLWQPGSARYGAMIVNDVPVKMDDGVVLRAQIGYPTDPATGQSAKGRFPVVIEHTPYVMFARPVAPIAFFAQHGYIYVVIRARGTGTSGGEFSNQGERDGEDGKEIINWAAHDLEGSDGRVALVGCSFPGALSLDDAAHVGPHSPLKAVVAACVGLNTQIRNGVFLLDGLPTPAFWNYMTSTDAVMGNAVAVKTYMIHQQAEMIAGGPAAYDGTYWQEHGDPMSLAPKIVRNGIPVLLWTGWHDFLEPGALRTYVAFQNLSEGRPLNEPMTPGQRTTARYQIIIGNGGHGANLDVGVYLEWLDTWLKGEHTGLKKTNTPMHLYEIGTGHWVNSAQFPPVSDYTRWFLDGASGLETAGPGKGGAETVRFEEPGSPQGRLSFTTAPLSRGATLAGPISASIYARSSNTELELIARLYDVGPDGNATLVSKGAVLGSQRTLDPQASWKDRRGTSVWPWPAQKRDSYLQPGKVYRFDIALLPVQWSVGSGHRLRLELTTQSPASACPPAFKSIGNDPCGMLAPQRRTLPGGVYTIVQGPRWPSALNLPQLPLGAFPAAASGASPTEWIEGFRSIRPGNATLPLDWGH